MELFDNLALGFGVAFTFQNLIYAFIGCLLGTLIGVLPGIGPVATIAMLLPATYALPPVAALIMLAGIYYGAQYGGSTTAILVNVPGETSSAVTCLDGHPMAKAGRAAQALAADFKLALTGTQGGAAAVDPRGGKSTQGQMIDLGGMAVTGHGRITGAPLREVRIDLLRRCEGACLSSSELTCRGGSCLRGWLRSSRPRSNRSTTRETPGPPI